MSELLLPRLIESPFGTIGRLVLGGKQWWSMERRSDGEYPCIPSGTWPLKAAIFYGGDGVGGKRDYPTFEIVVPGRSEIKIHIANKASELRGCIAPGTILTVLDSAWAIGASRQAFEDFWAMALTDPPQQLVVTWNPGGRP